MLAGMSAFKSSKWCVCVGGCMYIDISYVYVLYVPAHEY